MNSMRARPMPFVGSRHQRNAAAGLATLTIIAVRVSGRSPISTSTTSKRKPSVVDVALLALGAGHRDLLSIAQHLSGALGTDYAGSPSSRLTIAAWLVAPPWSVMMPAARFDRDPVRIRGFGDWSAPSRNRAMSAASWIRQTSPAAIASPMAAPAIKRLLFPSDDRLGSNSQSSEIVPFPAAPGRSRLSGVGVLRPFHIHRP